MLLLTAAGDRILAANESVAELLGYSRAELLRLSPGRLPAGPTDGQRWMPQSGVTVLRRRDGRTLSFRVETGRLPLPAVAGGRSDQHLVVTLRRVSEAAGRQRLEALLRTAIDRLPEALVIYDTEDRLLYFNRAYREFFPHMPPFEEVAGKHFFDVIRYSMDAPGVVRDPLARSDPEAYLRKRLRRLHEAAGEPFEQETAGCWHLVYEQRVAGVGFVGVRYDITEMKGLHHEMAEANANLAKTREAAELARQKAEEANRSKSEFLAMMSHELRTPLNAILGFSSLLAEEYLGALGNSKYRDYAQSIHDSGAHLLSIINDILDLAKVEAGKMEIDPEPLDARALAEECVALVRGLAEGRGLELACEVEAEGLLLTADRRAAKQMIVNLLSNACKFTEAGGRVCLRIAAAGTPAGTAADISGGEGGGTVVSVSDTGIGMSAEEIAIALEPFGQIGNVATSGRQGTGLGLPLVKSFIELHGGCLELDSQPGQGTTVRLLFRA